MSVTHEQINELLSPIVESMDLIIDRSSKPAALCRARDIAIFAIKGDRLGGKTASVIRLLVELSFLMRHNDDYKDADLIFIIKHLEIFTVRAML